MRRGRVLEWGCGRRGLWCHARFGGMRRALAGAALLVVHLTGAGGVRGPSAFVRRPPTCSCGPMMLDVLFKVKDEQDQTLSFRRSCR